MEIFCQSKITTDDVVKWTREFRFWCESVIQCYDDIQQEEIVCFVVGNIPNSRASNAFDSGIVTILWVTGLER